MDLKSYCSRENCTRLGISAHVGRMLAVLAIVVLLGAATGVSAKAQETPWLLGYKLHTIFGWCGDRFIYARQGYDPILIDLVAKTRIELQSLKQHLDQSFYTELLTCSPDGAWAITQTGGNADTESCPRKAKLELPDIELWDTVNRKRYIIGKGYFDFAWSADGTVLLHRLLPYCNLERDARNFLRVPPGARELHAVSVGDMVRAVLKDDRGWKDSGMIGALSWIGSDRFVVQLPERAASSLQSDVTENGAIILVHQSQGTATRVEQLNPGEFTSSWTFAIPQVPQSTSDVILLSAQCDTMLLMEQVFANGERITHEGMTCAGKYVAEGQGEGTTFKLDQARYCKGLKTGDVKQFCDPERNPPTWSRLRNGRHVVLVRAVQEINDGYADLFLMENDAGSYLK
jgi:hypothetical protein